MEKRLPLPPRMVEYRGETVKLKQLAIAHGINPRTLASRIDDGMPLEDALTKPVIKPEKKLKPRPVEEFKGGTRTKIVNALMETFFNDPDRFERWVEDEKDKDYGKFYKDYIMPFLKNATDILDKPNDKAVIAIEFNTGTGTTPPTLAIDGKTFDV